MDSFDAPPIRDAMTEYAMPQIHPVAVTIPPESESDDILWELFDRGCEIPNKNSDSPSSLCAGSTKVL